ncbi:MAG: hypothetical protein EBT13_05300 [Rhodobacteraceae bacterium]|nr:hypothetical protein [Paracoccaceae bacterium]
MTQKHTEQDETWVAQIAAIRDKQGIAKLKKGLRQALRIVDAASQVEYKTHKYRFGSTKKQRAERGGRFRDFAKKATAYRYRFNVERGRKPWRYQSMMKRKGQDNNYQGNLSHLLEDGSWNMRTGRMNKAYKIRRAAFEKVEAAARNRAVQAFKDAIVANP